MNQRLVIIEFENVDKAIAAYESPEYQAALALLKEFSRARYADHEAGA